VLHAVGQTINALDEVRLMDTRRAFKRSVSALALLLAGCNSAIVGQWRSIEPAAVSPDVLRIRQVEFNQDGQFQGTLIRRGRTAQLTGNYQYDGSQLVLVPDGAAAGGRQVYSVQRIGDVLVLTRSNVPNRLCRESGEYAPSSAPAPSTQPGEPTGSSGHTIDSKPGQP
jgi:hypothetical protein